jgi:hypothetical protein
VTAGGATMQDANMYRSNPVIDAAHARP